MFLKKGVVSICFANVVRVVKTGNPVCTVLNIFSYNETFIESDKGVVIFILILRRKIWKHYF